MIRLRLVITILLYSFAAACSQNSVPQTFDQEQNLLIQNVTVEPSTSGMGGIVKTSLTTGDPMNMAGVTVRLARVFWNDDKSDGAFVIEGGHSPSTVTDENGQFVFLNITPGDYVLVVGDVMGTHEIIQDTGEKAKIFTATEGQLTDIGIIIVNLPQ